ncbi:glycosyltransferase family 2 protein [Paenibacillus qinlingensis]|uniref:glycosyltransferase family 2 protein n=1 Tax=Paenibacillus qinlingensis TaxID=1837343 RepID=UPI0015652394|nr:glycosyltransferase family 2 protein [Paenibacillus qinlingensis]NQX59452.1 glycosyltransferase family 2 protein [Paenibacillus qinlingensis]
MHYFDIPIVLFFFRRKDTILKIIDRISKVKPRKLYLISDGPRNDAEREEVKACRSAVEQHITWECEIIRNYSDVNKGIYNRIGLGAKWVFESEEKAIFLEDDNLPEITFFEYCKEMLDLYKNDTRVLWICGTNYLEKYEPENRASYVFTQHLLPCGWASWSKKFTQFYDGEMSLFEDKSLVKNLKYEYSNKALFSQQYYSFQRTKHLLENDLRASSWDYQIAFSIRINGLYGISPINNQIQNIGVDEFSEHGGTSLNNVMTRRFCGIKSYPLEFPLVHPKTVLSDHTYEEKIGNIILYPWYLRTGKSIVKLLKPILGIGEYESFKTWMKKFGKGMSNK